MLPGGACCKLIYEIWGEQASEWTEMLVKLEMANELCNKRIVIADIMYDYAKEAIDVKSKNEFTYDICMYFCNILKSHYY